MTLLSYIHTIGIGVKGLKETACNNAALEEEVCPQIREQMLVPDLYVLTVESVAYKKRD